MQRFKLPRFFVVGTQKAGTTSLHDWLLQTKMVCLPSLKETHFFSSNESFKMGIDWYVNQFSNCNNNQLVYGEICPEYLYSNIAPLNIKKIIPNPKLIFIIRHPIERAYSQFLMAKKNGHENLDFYRALNIEKERIMESEIFRSRYGYLDRSLYIQQIQRYRNLFSEKLFHFIKFEDLIDNSKIGKQTFQNLCQFIGLDGSIADHINRNKKNPASTPRILFIRDILYNDAKFKKYFRIIFPRKEFRNKLALLIDNLNRKKLKNVSIPSVPDFFIKRTLDEISKLEHSCGLNLSDWKERTINYRK